MVANEFVDALPVRQFVRVAQGWRERRVTTDRDRFVPTADGIAVDGPVATDGSMIEACPSGVALVADLARRIARQGGAALLIDYGYEGPAIGDTLQAVRGHAHADPFADPGEADLTAHVDFAPLAAAASGAGCRVHGSVTQGDFLDALGIAARAAALARAQPSRTEAIEAARARLAGTRAMGALFRVLAFTAAGWPAPAGLTPRTA